MHQRQGSSAFLVLVLLLAAGIFGGVLYAYRNDLHEAYFRWQQGPVPEPVSKTDYALNKEETAAEPKEEAEKTPEEPAAQQPTVLEAEPSLIQAQMNLRVPFIVQAPFGVWDPVHEDACEEASIIMLQAYFEDESGISPEEAEKRIQALVAKEMEIFGFFESTTAEQTVQLMQAYYGTENLVVKPLRSIDDLKAEIARGYPVLIPADGHVLDNPFFKGDGPDYHMVVAKGYTSTHIITNDPGTKRGADFLYSYETIMDAVHDWNGGDVPHGAKVMIVVR